jgi:hypothetical protein
LPVRQAGCTVTNKKNKIKQMKKHLFKILGNLNKILLPSFTKKRLDMTKAKKWQLAIIGWRYFVTKNSL